MQNDSRLKWKNTIFKKHGNIDTNILKLYNCLYSTQFDKLVCPSYTKWTNVRMVKELINPKNTQFSLFISHITYTYTNYSKLKTCNYTFKIEHVHTYTFNKIEHFTFSILGIGIPFVECPALS